MPENSKRYWTSLIERDSDEEGPRPEFAERVDDRMASRRAFLKAAGFSFAGLAASACSRPPVEHALPFVQGPDGITPGRPYSYATTCGACEARCGLLVTNRDGRPIKIEGNPDHPLSAGATCAIGQASVLGLYDSLRLAHPLNNGARATWAAVDQAIVAALERIRQEGGAVRLVTGTINSPTLAAVIAEFVSTFANARHVSYDPISASALLEAHLLTHGVRAVPRYRFEAADVIVSLDADFLGTWISPVEFAGGYTKRRRPDGDGPEGPAMSYHAQIESRLSLTGSKADRRLRVAPTEIAHVATSLAARVAARAGTPVWRDVVAPSTHDPVLDQLADRLWQARGRGLAVSGSDDLRVQLLCNFINHLIDAYGATLDLTRPSHQRTGSDRDLDILRGELARGEVAALFVAGVNPVFDLPEAAALANDLRRVPLAVSTAERLDETSGLAHYVCPDHHYLESWGDAEAISGVVSLQQPAIHPLGATRSLIESLTAWSGRPRSARDAILECWQRDIYPRAGGADSFQLFWDRTLERGVTDVASQPPHVKPFDPAAVQPVLHPDERPEQAFGLVLYPKVGMLDGRHAHNAWLHELPDPVT
ncbi:MAG: [Fe-S]-binding protein, partial [Acidobacteria bacterium]|nr:[Fe-S]-binding protein [Acidobacteriota bacterium]